ncbi:uncharacterized protein CTHT_0068620 [Thermochaetoides thermophila DSM 1495]|uniref:Uncharacterized protein n=1 Tax=Chaetomium thermophilum (strain DSM 1495 / CBS 144.50 / IMI 039719) TaxID=759272 RepID=G0SH42_CHATD|nr:hypothetical protein CTHT_0068620 [Thermochaetoides thermophila DSM 1495]EGS17531.1 hypothetical protein CTHT_0068620 [Thermochaetoides thermophila DSM 1495]
MAPSVRPPTPTSDSTVPSKNLNLALQMPNSSSADPEPHTSSSPSPPTLTNESPSSASQNRASVRLSTYSMTPSLAPSVGSLDPEIRPIVDGLERLKNPPLEDKQRVFLNEEKRENLARLALNAKLERALSRRMTSQDAVMRPRKPSVVEVVNEKKEKV